MKLNVKRIRRIFSLMIVLVFVAGTMVSVNAVTEYASDSGVEPVFHEGNFDYDHHDFPDCEYKSEKVEVHGGTDSGSLTITVHDVDYKIYYELDEGQEFLEFWTEGDAEIVKRVFVKGSNNTFEYIYDPLASEDSGLRSPDTKSENIPAISWFAFVIEVCCECPPDEPAICVTKLVDDDYIPSTGQDVTFTFRITNTGPVDVTVTSINDSVFSDLLTIAEAQNGNADIILESSNPDDYFEFTFDVDDLEPIEGLAPHSNTVTVIAEDDDPETDDATCEATETVTFYNPEQPPEEPAIQVTKVVDDDSIPYTGQAVTFTFTITNPGPVPVMVTSIMDSVFDNLLPEALADNAITEIYLSIDESISFTYGPVTLSSTLALTPHSNTVTVFADDIGNAETCPVSAQATEIVNFFGDDDDDDEEGPDVDLTKSVDQSTSPAPGTFTFTIRIENTGDTTFTIAEFRDSNFDLLPPELQALINEDLVVGEIIEIPYTVIHSEVGTYNNIAFVKISDVNGKTKTDTDNEQVRVTAAAASLQVFGAEMPQTGDSGMDTFALIGFIFLLLSGGLVVYWIRKERA